MTKTMSRTMSVTEMLLVPMLATMSVTLFLASSLRLQRNCRMFLPAVACFLKFLRWVTGGHCKKSRGVMMSSGDVDADVGDDADVDVEDDVGDENDVGDDVGRCRCRCWRRCQ